MSACKPGSKIYRLATDSTQTMCAENCVHLKQQNPIPGSWWDGSTPGNELKGESRFCVVQAQGGSTRKIPLEKLQKKDLLMMAQSKISKKTKAELISIIRAKN